VDAGDEIVLTRGVQELRHRAAPARRIDELRHALAGFASDRTEVAALAILVQLGDQALALGALLGREVRRGARRELALDLRVVRSRALEEVVRAGAGPRFGSGQQEDGEE